SEQRMIDSFPLLGRAAVRATVVRSLIGETTESGWFRHLRQEYSRSCSIIRDRVRAARVRAAQQV
ncbi:hypothetical protein, partial [Burkholderia multivorans]|uniref:hypothetical protein n=1 Tax=Burkholderia multivorans TaxID=87883 RepID=UPI001C65C8F1